MTDIDVLRARQEALEVANETLHRAFRGIDGDAHLALEVAKQNVKLMTALRATQLEHGRVISGLVTDVAGLKTDVARLETDVAGLKGDVAEMKGDVVEMKGDVAEIKGDVGEIKRGLTEFFRRLPAPEA